MESLTQQSISAGMCIIPWSPFTGCLMAPSTPAVSDSNYVSVVSLLR